jgi:hypothetical protein
MIGDNTDRSWEMLGRTDPYYGVLTDDKFRRAHARVHVRPLHIAASLIQGRRWNEAPMQMNRYDLNRLFVNFHEMGLTHVTAEFMDDGGNVGAYLLMRKPA